MSNLDSRVVADFGREWQQFNQAGLDAAELRAGFEAYFSVFPFVALPPEAQGFDLGCGSGRWASLMAPQVGTLHCIDASEAALAVARRNLAVVGNCVFHVASVDHIPLPDGSMDFGYSLGVLHHVPDTPAGLAACVRKLRPGAPFLVYLYYAFDNRPAWFVALWRLSDLLRRVVAGLPHAVKVPLTTVMAAVVYYPLARLAGLAERAGRQVDAFPLSFYRDKTFYTMRTDALDRFGTRLEQRFSREQIESMMQAAGLREIRFREAAPYWCAVGIKA